MVARDGVHLHAPKSKPAPTQLRVANAIEGLSLCTEDDNAARVCFWRKIPPRKVNFLRILPISGSFPRARPGFVAVLDELLAIITSVPCIEASLCLHSALFVGQPSCALSSGVHARS
jgi:hypothetical protein